MVKIELDHFTRPRGAAGRVRAGRAGGGSPMDDHDDLWIDFVNSDWRHHLGLGDADRLEDPRWLRAFLKRWGFLGVDAGDRRVRARLRRLRAVLQRAAAALRAGRRIRPADLDALNGFLGATVRHRLARRSGGYGLPCLREHQNSFRGHSPERLITANRPVDRDLLQLLGR